MVPYIANDEKTLVLSPGPKLVLDRHRDDITSLAIKFLLRQYHGVLTDIGKAILLAGEAPFVGGERRDASAPSCRSDNLSSTELAAPRHQPSRTALP
jgi:hypothetical protein